MFAAASYITCVTKSVKPPLELKKRVLSPKQNKLRNFRLGARGERVAKKLLIDKGYRILAENVVFKTQEIDLVALDNRYQEVVFVEVKTRWSADFGNPSGAVNYHKLKSMRQAANQFLRAKGLRNLYRFDIIAVTPGRVEHFENITWP